jgi:hypothetical protein
MSGINQVSDSDSEATRSRLLDYVLLTATLSFAEEFRVDHTRRAEVEAMSEVRSVLSARRALLEELSELESRVARISRSLAAQVVNKDALSLVQAYAVLDTRRIRTAVERIHRHLLTLYPSVTEEVIEEVRLFANRLDSALTNGYENGDSEMGLNAPGKLLFDTLRLAKLVHTEID